MKTIIQFFESYYNSPPLWRIALVIVLLILVMVLEKILKKDQAFRWKTYSLWLIMAMCGMLFGFLLDLITINLSLEYYRIGKAVSVDNIFITALQVGGVGGFVAGIWIGAIFLYKNRQYVRESRTIPWDLLRPIVIILISAVFGVLLAWSLPLVRTPDPYYILLLKNKDVEAFFRVQQMHAGAYLFAFIGTLVSLRLKSSPKI